MTHFPQPNPNRRSPRIPLGGSVFAAIRLMDGRRTKAKLQTVSVTGGLMFLNQPLAEGDFVEIVFATPTGQVQGMAEMLTPRKNFSAGCQQAFRFVALGDNDHQNLRRAVETSMDRQVLGIKSKCVASGWSV